MKSATLRFCRARHSACSCSSRWYSASSTVPYTILGVGDVLPSKLPKGLWGNKVPELGALTSPPTRDCVDRRPTRRTSISLGIPGNR
jgi:hypothetical protein